ncbi:MAG: hypothetical protein AB7S71_12455 [Dongiaceae bacterium]
MDSTTNITDLLWDTLVGEERTVMPRVKKDSGAESAVTKFGDEGVQSSTTSLPQTMLLSWSDLLEAGITRRLFDRLTRIAMQPAGWRGPTSKPLRHESLKLFIKFWSTVREDAVEPELALTPDGSLQAEWYKSDRQRLDVTFVEPKAIFGLFGTNSILEGAEPATTVAALLKGHPAKPLQWSSR